MAKKASRCINPEPIGSKILIMSLRGFYMSCGFISNFIPVIMLLLALLRLKFFENDSPILLSRALEIAIDIISLVKRLRLLLAISRHRLAYFRSIFRRNAVNSATGSLEVIGA